MTLHGQLVYMVLIEMGNGEEWGSRSLLPLVEFWGTTSAEVLSSLRLSNNLVSAELECR
jgi:hypothetical protein